jgi:hypothetical protein
MRILVVTSGGFWGGFARSLTTDFFYRTTPLRGTTYTGLRFVRQA